jgi:hypothetical protein
LTAENTQGTENKFTERIYCPPYESQMPRILKMKDPHARHMLVRGSFIRKVPST